MGRNNAPKVHKMKFKNPWTFSKTKNKKSPKVHQMKSKDPPKWQEENWKLPNFKNTKLKIGDVHKIKTKDPQTSHQKNN